VLLARASADHEAARVLLESSLARFADVLTGMTAPRQVMITIANAIPYPSLALAAAHASISEQILATYPPGADGRALWLNTFAVLLGDLGRREDALTAVEEAVTAYRALAETRPDAFLPNLAMALNNQSVCLAGLGRREDALTAIEEAVTIRRALAQARPNLFADGYANSLETQARILAALGREAEAETAQAEAAAIRNR
jgi:tetratricopeptide (TPR) repeat protein